MLLTQLLFVRFSLLASELIFLAEMIKIGSAWVHSWALPAMIG